MTDTPPTNAGDVPFGSFRDPPNAITLARIVIALGCFVAMSVRVYDLALVLFVVAAGTDFLDGYWARRWGPITRLGRVLDPFADKLLICGAYVYLAAIPKSRVEAWMAVLILARELLVTTLRAAVESRGGDFSAVAIGKWKMVTQCVAVGGSMLLLSPWSGAGERLAGLVVAAIWLSLAVTLASAVTYTRAAINALRR